MKNRFWVATVATITALGAVEIAVMVGLKVRYPRMPEAIVVVAMLIVPLVVAAIWERATERVAVLNRFGNTTSSARIVLPPGSRLRSALSFVYGRKTMAAVFDQLLGDVQAEWCAHECAGRRWHARMATLRGYVEIGQAVAAHGVTKLFKLVARIWTITH